MLTGSKHRQLPPQAALLEQIVERLAARCWSAGRASAAAAAGVPVWRSTVVRGVKSEQVLRASFGRDARRQRGGSACTPSGRWCRTTRTGCSCAGRRRSARSAHRRRTAATAGCRNARSGTLRAPPSGSASSGRRRPAARGPARAPAAGAAPRPFGPRGFGFVLIAALAVFPSLMFDAGDCHRRSRTVRRTP